MATLQIYHNDSDAQLFDGKILITFAQRYKVNTGFSKNGITRMLNRMGYVRKSNWVKTDWGYESSFVRKPVSL